MDVPESEITGDAERKVKGVRNAHLCAFAFFIPTCHRLQRQPSILQQGS